MNRGDLCAGIFADSTQLPKIRFLKLGEAVHENFYIFESETDAAVYSIERFFGIKAGT